MISLHLRTSVQLFDQTAWSIHSESGSASVRSIVPVRKLKITPVYRTTLPTIGQLTRNTS